MPGEASNAAKLAIGGAAVPLLAMSAVLMVLAGGGANAAPTSTVCGGGGTAQTIGTVTLDAEQMGNAQTIVSVAAARRLPVYAADVAVTAAYTESGLHNSSTESDHDSEGLFQQRISIYTRPVADDPVQATTAFLNRLITLTDWQTSPVGVDAQAVEVSDHPERYQPNAALARQLVGQFWPAATATAARPAPASTPSPGRSGATSARPAVGAGPAVCAGGGGAITRGGQVAGTIVGPTGNVVAGTTTIPAGFVITGSTKGRVAVAYALEQLGKPYLFGAAGPNAYDCSGLTMAAWAAAGIALPHLAAAQTSAGTPEPTNLSQAVGGDLVMIPGSDGTPTNPGHVGMIAGYLDRPDGRHLLVLQAPMSGVPIELSQISEWSGLITNVRHIA